MIRFIDLAIILIFQCNEKTLEAFIVYLDLSDDKNKLELRFRQALEEGHIPNKIRLQNFSKRLEA